MKSKNRLYSKIFVSIFLVTFLVFILSTASAGPIQSASPAATYAYITNAGSNNVSVIDTANNNVTATVSVGSLPFGVAVSPDGTKVYVTNTGDSNISVINTVTNNVTATVNVGNAPTGVAVTPDGTKVYVANSGFDSTVSVIDTTNNTVIATVPVGRTPSGVAVNPSGTKVYVANVDSMNVSVIDTATNTITATVDVGGLPKGVAVTPDGTKVYVTNTGNSNVSVIDTNTNTVTATIPVKYSFCGGVAAISPDGSKVYMDYDRYTVSVIDTTTNNVTALINVGNWSGGFAFNPTGTKVYVTNPNSNAVSVIDTATNNVIASINVGKFPIAFGQFIVSPSKAKQTDSPLTITVNESGIPIVDYGYVKGVFIGKQLNPVTIANKALSYDLMYQRGNESCKQLFLNNANYLVENAVLYDNYTLWQYNFPWPEYKLESPWFSGMAQGLGVKVLIKAYNMTGDKKYLDSANLALNSLNVEVKDGGVTYKDKNGWWYQEYVAGTDEKPRVLNGMIYALLGIYEYYKFTGDQNAKFMFDQGIISVKNNLYKYDTGNWTYYDTSGHKANTQYHQLHINQMLQLYEITKDPFFKEYNEKFEEYYQSSLDNKQSKNASSVS